MTRTVTRAEVWDRLVAARIVAGPAPSGETGEADDSRMPWFVRALIGIAGWIAAAFLIGFISAALSFVVDDNAMSIVVGLAIIAGAYGLFRTAGGHAFASQFAVAISFAGQVLVWIGIEPGSRDAEPEWLAIAAFQAALAVVLPNFVVRVWCAGAAAMAVAILLFLSGAYFLSIGLLAAATAFVWFYEFRWPRMHSAVRAIGYGLTLSLIVVQGTAFGTHALYEYQRERLPLNWVPDWVGWVLPGAVLMVVVWQLFARRGVAISSTNAFIAVTAAAAVSLASFKAPGIATGLMLVLLGYSNANRSLLVLGLIALLSYLSAYYYLLETTLLMKSLILAVTGAVLLAVRWTVMMFLFSTTVRLRPDTTTGSEVSRA
jgi:hypothetical protein